MSTRPSLVPPHPDVLSSYHRPRESLVAGVAQQVLAAGQQLLGHHHEAHHQKILGKDDGVIFMSAQKAAGEGSKTVLRKSPLRGDIRCLVVLVEFPDLKIKPNSKERFSELFFDPKSNSVNKFYNEASGGLVNFVGDVVGPFMLPHKIVEYANGDSGTQTTFPNAQTMAADALKACREGINFDQLDNDKNGLVDAFIVVHAGSGAEAASWGEQGNKIWSLQWNLPETVKVSPNTSVSGFLTIPDDAQVGVCAHESGHLIFQWPDLYDTDGSSEGLGDWCLMASGSWGFDRSKGPRDEETNPAGSKPSHPSGFLKLSQGWISQIAPKIDGPIDLEDVKGEEKKIVKLWTNGKEGVEYFLVENRQQTGYDASLPIGGLLIYHVNERQPDNSNEKRPLIALEQADGLNELNTTIRGATGGDRGDTGDLYPGSTLNTTFSATSKPNSKSAGGQDTGVEVTNISQPGQRMTFNVKVVPKHTSSAAEGSSPGVTA